MQTNLLKRGDVVEDLQCGGLSLIQNKAGYRFSTDSVLLANFAKIRKRDVYLDLCTGSGVVALLATFKNSPKKAFAVEVQPRLADSARRSILLNNINITLLEEDLKKTPKTLGAESVDVITVNPPYNQAQPQKINEISIATHEVMTNLPEVIKVSAKLLKFGGKLFMVLKSDRLVDALYFLRTSSLEPKVLRIVYPKLSKEPNLVLIEAKKGGAPGIKILSPLILMNEDGTETDELKDIYNRKSNLNA